MSTTFERTPEETDALALLTSGVLAPTLNPETLDDDTAAATLGTLSTGAHLIVRCRKDWRTATVLAIAPDKVTLSVGSPNGRTYRLRRPTDAPLTFDGAIPLLGTTVASSSCWRAGLARYDVRW